MIRTIYYRPSAHAYSEAVGTLTYTLEHNPDTHRLADPHKALALHTHTHSAASNTADMDVAQEREDVKVVLGGG